MKQGYVYCLSNPSYRNIYKIGLTTKTIDRRMQELYKTGVLYPFKCEFAKRVKDVFYVENTLHKKLAQFRCSSEREFFKVPREKIYKLFAQTQGKWYRKPRRNKTVSILYDVGRNRRLKRKAHRSNPYAHVR